MPSELSADQLEQGIQRLDEFLRHRDGDFKVETDGVVLDAARAYLAQLRTPKDDLAEARITYLRSCLQAIASQSVWNSVESSKYALEQDDLTKARATGGDR